jgi:hypothetical protein
VSGGDALCSGIELVQRWASPAHNGDVTIRRALSGSIPLKKGGAPCSGVAPVQQQLHSNKLMQIMLTYFFLVLTVSGGQCAADDGPGIERQWTLMTASGRWVTKGHTQRAAAGVK